MFSISILNQLLIMLSISVLGWRYLMWIVQTIFLSWNSSMRLIVTQFRAFTFGMQKAIYSSLKNGLHLHYLQRLSLLQLNSGFKFMDLHQSPCSKKMLSILVTSSVKYWYRFCWKWKFDPGEISMNQSRDRCHFEHSPRLLQYQRWEYPQLDTISLWAYFRFLI